MSTGNDTINSYKLDIRQQPRQGKAVGFKQYYGNFLDPALILEVKLPSGLKQSIERRHLLCHVSICSENEDENCTTVIIPASDEKDAEVHPHMRGGRVVSPLRLIDPNDSQKKLFFVFPDLAIKTNGKFRLVAKLVHLGRASILDTVTTNPILIYPARSYPGIKPPTALSESFSNQGALRLGRNVKPKDDFGSLSSEESS